MGQLPAIDEPPKKMLIERMPRNMLPNNITRRHNCRRGKGHCALYGLPSSGFQNTISFSCFLHRFLCSTWKSRFFAPTPQYCKAGARRRLSRLAGAPTFPRTLALARPCPDSSEHGGTLDTVGMTIRGEPAFGRADQSRHNLVFGESKDPNHDAAMRIGSEAPRRRTPFFSSAQKP